MDIRYMKAWLYEYFEDKSNLYTTIACVAFLIGWGGYKLYNWHSNTVQTKSQLAFNDALNVYNKALATEFFAENKNAISAEWEDAEMAFRLGYEQNKGSSIAPFYLVYQAQALARQGDFDKAFATIDEAIKKFSGDNNFSYLFKITRTLIEFDVDQTTAAENLKKLAYDAKNPLDVMALYYLAEYYYSLDDIETARKIFNDVVAKNEKNVLNIESPWVELAKERLQEI